jgi:hypothetical protein
MADSKKDFTQAAFDVFQQAIGEAEKPKPLSGRKANSSKGGKVGGEQRAKKLTADERKAIAKKAAEARWSDVESDPPPPPHCATKKVR